MAQKKKPHKSGRARATIDWATVEAMLARHSPGSEVAAVLGIYPETLYDAVVRDKGMSFTDFAAKCRQRGCDSLRAMQWKSAESGNVTMQIFLGKNYLDQRDVPEKKTEYTEEQKKIIESIFSQVTQLQAMNKQETDKDPV